MSLRRAGKATYALVVYLFLYIPIAVLVIFSFNDSKYTLAWKGFTTRWFVELASNSQLLEAAWHSVAIAVTAATASTILGGLIAITLFRYKFIGSRLVSGALFVLMMSPDIVMGISMLILFLSISMPLGFWSLFLSHVALCVPFAAVTIGAGFRNFDMNVIEAAQDLGAGEFELWRAIILPMIAPSLAASWLMSCTLSLDDVMISFFTSGPTYEILPLRIYSMVRLGIKPEVNALCTLMIAITIATVFISHRLLKEKS